jgi:hypothetical protein
MKLLADDWLTIPAWVSLPYAADVLEHGEADSDLALHDGYGHMYCDRYDYFNIRDTGNLLLHRKGVYKRGFGYPSPTPRGGQDPTTFTHPEIIINRKVEYPKAQCRPQRSYDIYSSNLL